MPNVIQTPGAVTRRGGRSTLALAMTRARAAPKRKVKPKKSKNGKRKQGKRAK